MAGLHLPRLLRAAAGSAYRFGMAFHHVAIATRRLEKTHAFYTEVMGFRLAKVVAAPAPEGGWAKHVFYETGDGQMIAFWELHDVPGVAEKYPTDLNRSLGLPAWVNHIAFDAPTLEQLEAISDRWRAHGITVAWVDHGWCQSIYTTDPNGVLVEFCCSTRVLDAGDAEEAARLFADPQPEFEEPPAMRLLEPLAPATTTA